MKLARALGIALVLQEKMFPLCGHIQIAGSIRRWWNKSQLSNEPDYIETRKIEVEVP